MQTKPLRLRTIAVPLILMMVHAIVINLVADLYSYAYQWISQSALFPGLASWPVYGSRDALVLQEYPRIAVFFSLALVPLYAMILVLRRSHDPDAVWTRRPAWSDIWPALSIMIGLLGVTNLIFSLLTRLSQTFPQIDTMMTDYAEQSGAFGPNIGYGWLILGITILAPLSEELLFRGIIQGELRRVLPEWLAVVIQALLFALFHWQPVQVIYVILPALALGALYALTRSIWVPVLMHMVFNFLGSVLPSLIGSDETLNTIVVLTEFAFIGVGLIAGTALALRRRET